MTNSNMSREDALNLLATHGYNVGYGAKKHLATYDIIEKVPGTISFLSIAFGLLSLKYFSSSLEEHVSVFLTLFGVVSLYISFYLKEKDNYRDAGKKITEIYAQLQTLYYTIKNQGNDFTTELDKANKLMSQFYDVSISKQIFLSDWYAHYKFFCQMQIDWVDDQKSFTLLKDKIPYSFHATLVVVFITLLFHFNMYSWSINFVKEFALCP